MMNIKDKEFIRTKIPMTKFNIRTLNMAYLELAKNDVFLDIGGGTGSVSIEAASRGANVTTIECDKQAVELIKQNAVKFKLNLDIIHGHAPGDLPDCKFNKVFVGGSRGKLKEIFQYLDTHLFKEGILCANFIVLKNLVAFMDYLKEFNYTDIETHLIQSAEMTNTKAEIFKGENPIYIVKGKKI